MSDLPAPTTRRETIQLYEALAKKYIKYDGKKSMCQICTPYMRRTGFTPDRRAIWKHIKKLREQ